jgi:hypothetical protein
VLAVVVSSAVLAAGLWLTFGSDSAGMGSFGVLLLVLGAVFLAVNLFLRSRGFPPRRR